MQTAELTLRYVTYVNLRNVMHGVCVTNDFLLVLEGYSVTPKLKVR